mgnify:CR=1 FL=1
MVPACLGEVDVHGAWLDERGWGSLWRLVSVYRALHEAQRFACVVESVGRVLQYTQLNAPL